MLVQKQQKNSSRMLSYQEHLKYLLCIAFNPYMYTNNMKQVCSKYMSQQILHCQPNVKLFMYLNLENLWQPTVPLTLTSSRQIYIFLIFPRKQDLTFHENCLLIFPRKQEFTIHANCLQLHEMSNPDFWEK